MKKTIFIIGLAFAAAFANSNSKFEFNEVIEQHNCLVTKWLENDYESGVKWRHYAKVSCNVKERMPIRIAGLKFLDMSKNLKGEYIYTYGED